MRNKKGFTMVELLAVIVILAVLSTVGLVSVNQYMTQARQASYTDYEKTLKGSTENALVQNSRLIPATNEKVVIDGRWLFCHGYIKVLKDPKNSGRDCGEESYVIVSRGADISFNMNLEYQVCLKCGHYQTAACSQSISGIRRLSADSHCVESSYE